ncbi:MAG: entericidin [Rhodobacteraceae bacterium]|nr:entericidin [Paracoccaceae bacterium]
MMRNAPLIAVLTAFLALSGCATIEGVGRDISGGANRVSGWLN